MERTELLARIKRVSPALSTKGVIPAFACVFFDGKTATAYDDTIGIVTPLETPVTGGVQGGLLLGFLGSAKGKTVEFSGEGEGFEIKCGRSKLKTPLLDIKYRPAELTVPEDLVTRPVTADVVDHFKVLRGLMGYDPADAWKMGVTAELNKDGRSLWAADAMTLTRIHSEKGGKGKPFVMPPRFVEQACGMHGMTELGYSAAAESLIASYQDGTHLWSRPIDDVRPKEYLKAYEGFDWAHKGFITQPKGFLSALERALLIAAGGLRYEVPTRIRIRDGKMTMVTTSKELGVVRDSFAVPGHQDIEVDFTADLIKRAVVAGFVDLKFTDRALLMRGEVGGCPAYHIVATLAASASA